MHKLTKLKNGLTLITVSMPHLDSVTSLIAVGAGSRYETKRVSGISHFLEHMFFKGSTKFSTAEQISSLIDGIGAINNAATSKEVTYYWIKSASKNIELASDILSSMIKESLLSKTEIEREKGVITEELRMLRDIPARLIWDLYERLQFGDQPLGWDLGGDEKTISSFIRSDFVGYMESLYSSENTVLVYAGKLPRDIERLATNYFLDIPQRTTAKFKPFKSIKQIKPRVNIFYKQTDQANLILGTEGYDRYDDKRYTADILSVILGEGMSSRLFVQVRERRGLAYRISASSNSYADTGTFTVSGGLKLEKVYEGLEVIYAELMRMVMEKISEDELKKAKEMIRGRLALHSESTNFLAEYFGTNFILEHKIETFEEYLEKIDLVTIEDVQSVAKELFKKDRYNVQIIGPFQSGEKFEKILR
ncbi:insulinase family protein [Candidatus Daviesbacteria bacterium]|nr:insulinase family protein [Candidatus Daviesbacteria bacterium]